MKFYDFKEDEKRVDIFNERWYRKPNTDKFYRNVTTILGIVDKGYGFQDWIKGVGYNADIILDRAGKFGSAFHEMVEKFLLGGTVSYYDYTYLGDSVATELWERFSLWQDWWQELNAEHEVKYKPEGIEHIIYCDKYEYAGTIDFLCTVDGEPTIFDWKTSKDIYDTYKQQLSAYMNPYSIKKGFLVQFPQGRKNCKKKGYRVVEVDRPEERFDLFLSAKKLFDSEYKDKPKVLSLPLEYKIGEQ